MATNEELFDLHEHLGLHELNSGGQCVGCRRRFSGKTPVVFKPHPLLIKLIPDIQYKIEWGSLTAGDILTLDRLRGGNYEKVSQSMYPEHTVAYMLNVTEPDILDMLSPFEAMVVQYIEDTPTVVPPGHKPLIELPIVRERLKSALARDGRISCDAYAPKRLGWRRIAETSRNITNGCKAVAYLDDCGTIGIYHSSALKELRVWEMRCKQLTVLLFNCFGTTEVIKQATGTYKSYAARMAAAGQFRK